MDDSHARNYRAPTVALVAVLLLAGGLFVWQTQRQRQQEREVERVLGQKPEQVLEQSLAIRASLDAAEAFLKDLQAGRLDAAHAATTAAFKRRCSRRQLEELIRQHPFLSRPEAGQLLVPNFVLTPQSQSVSLYRFQAIGAGQKKLFTIWMARTEGSFRVDRIEVEAPKQP